MKHILGLDLGTTSIGFAHIIEDPKGENSSIEHLGVRVLPLTTDEQTNFEKGKPITTNAERTLKRSMRRNLDRYQDRRKNLIEALSTNHVITKDDVLTEDGKNTTFQTWQLRAKAVTERIEKNELARVLLAINKKRGYKSSRKAKNQEEGHIVDGMAIAKRLYEDNITPGQLVFSLLKEGKKYIPEFYRSDLQQELDKIWTYQQQFYPDLLTPTFYNEIKGKGQRPTAASFWNRYKFNTAENKGTREEKRLQAYGWRSKAVTEKLEKEIVAYVISEVNNNLYNASGYLAAISDRSKELLFTKQTVGQYLYRQLLNNPHTSLRNQVFYRQDYLDEFEAIWEQQAKHHKELTPALKAEIRDIIIFYQRKLKSQKNLISLCEFEKKEIEITNSGKTIKKKIGHRVAPKSSPLFQEFKIWQTLQNVVIHEKRAKHVNVSSTDITLDEEEFVYDLITKQQLFNELNIKGNLTASKALECLGHKGEFELNYDQLEGNRTNQALYEAYLKILELEGYDLHDIFEVKSNKDEITLKDLSIEAGQIKETIRRIFDALGINIKILEFNASLTGQALQQQPSYQLWHLLYSYEGDNSADGNEILYDLLEKKYGFKKEHGKILANIELPGDYGSLSTKAIQKIYPFIKENKYSDACSLAGYNHSAASITKEEIQKRPLKNQLDLFKKNSLRNPVVEKILNQMINVVNTLIEHKSERDQNGNIVSYFKFDEIRIELARELKKSAKERAEMTGNINTAKLENERITKLLKSEFGIKNPSRNDIIRYKLYDELKNNGYKDIYTDTYIPREILFSKQIDVDHIIPQSRLFDDSFSNKTVIYRKDNLKKGNKTAIEYIESEGGPENVTSFIQRIEHLYNPKNKEESISKAKFLKLQKHSSDIGDGFIERDLRDSQYIAKMAKTILFGITRSVVSTTGSITDRLREDWGLVNIMQELNFEKYKQLGLTEKIEKKDGSFKERIVDWTKRNDHRHHAMDALTVAFTKHNHIQYLNYLNARYNESHKQHQIIKNIELLETHVVKDDTGNSKRVFNSPMPNFRAIAKEHLERILVSFKAKNKVVTKNKNKIKTAKGEKVKIELTPRGQLHKETIYKKYRYPVSKEEKVSAKFDLETINKVANKTFRSLLIERLNSYDNDPKKAFAGKNALAKNPIYLDETKIEVIPEKVTLTWFEEGYAIRKDVTPDNFKDLKSIDKVIDLRVRKIIHERLQEFNNDSKLAFSNLDKNPIWLNRDKGICIKRVTITGISNAESLHFKKDHFGNEILTSEGERIPVDFVSTGNNHHVAIYKDETGKLQERVVSLFDAVQLVNAGLPVVDKEYNKNIGWEFLFSMKQNEYFVFPNENSGFNPNEIDLLDPTNYKLISPNLYRVQKLATKNYMFRHHLETTVEDKKALSNIAFKLIQSTGHLDNIKKVRINHIGIINHIGE